MILGLCYRTSMLIKLFKKLEESKWLPWVGTAPFILIPIAIVFGGEITKAAGVFAFFASMWLGIVLGGKIANVVSIHLLKASEDANKRMTSGGCAFGLLFLPALVGSFTNSNLGTSIEMRSLGAHFLWACIGAGSFPMWAPKSLQEAAKPVVGSMMRIICLFRLKADHFANAKGRPDPGAAFRSAVNPNLNAWRTGSSYGLWPYRISSAQPHGCRGSGSLPLSERRAATGCRVAVPWTRRA